jgi:hypothetical protein
MKKTLLKSASLLMAFIMLIAQNQSLAARTIAPGLASLDESALSYDQTALDLALGELNELDNYLSMNDGVTFADMEAAGSTLITNVSDVSAPLGMADDGESPLGIPAFWWGCILGWVGLLLVFVLTDKDKDQTKKALNGCLVSTGVTIALYVVYFFVILESSDL